MTLRIGFLLLASLALSAPASAATVVVYGPGLDADSATAQAKAKLGTSEFTVVGSVIDLAGGSPDAPVIVGAPASTCAAEEVLAVDKSSPWFATTSSR
jgi:hypothetical protein